MKLVYLVDLVDIDCLDIFWAANLVIKFLSNLFYSSEIHIVEHYLCYFADVSISVYVLWFSS